MFYHQRKGFGFAYNNGFAESVYETGTGHDLTSKFSDGKWHFVAAKLYTNSLKTHVIGSVYVDGILTVKDSIARQAGFEIANTLPLTLGAFSGEVSDFNMNIGDIRIYNIALSEEVIYSSACEVTATSSSPNYGNIIGYWPCNDIGNIMANKVSGKPDFILQGPYRNDLLSNTLPCLPSSQCGPN